MALIYIDGFDHYSDANTSSDMLSNLAPGLWTSSGTSAAAGHGTTYAMPELGGRGLRHRWTQGNTGSQDGYGQRLILPSGTISSGDTLGIGFHLYMDETPSGEFQGQTSAVVAFAAPTGKAGVSLRVRPSGAVRIAKSNSGAAPVDLTSDSPTFLVSKTLYHIEMQMHFHASEGWFEIRVNGQTFFTGSGLNTVTSTNLSCLSFDHPANNGNDTGTFLVDNLYVYDLSGTVNNDWLGERNVYTLMPDGDSSDQEWALSAGSDGYALIDEIPADGDTSYIEASEAPLKSNFTLEALPSSDISILGIQTVVVAEKTGTSDTRITFGPQGDVSADTPLTQDSYLHFISISETNPDTEEQWKPTEVNDLVIDIERTV